MPGKEKINFDAVELLLSSKSKEHQLRTLLTRINMGEYIEMGNRQQNFEDIIIERVKKIQDVVNRNSQKLKKIGDT